MLSRYSIIRLINTNSIGNIIRNSYKSSISLDNLYPKTQLNPLEKPSLNFELTDQKFSGFIPINKLQITHKTSSKPGGQHVNKTCSGVEVRFHLDSSDWIPDWIREKLKEKQINNITKDGFLIVKSEKTRKAILNQADCLEKIRAMIFEASFKPKGLSESDLQKIQIDKKIAEGRRLVDKRKKSEKKIARKHPIYDASNDYYGN